MHPLDGDPLARRRRRRHVLGHQRGQEAPHRLELLGAHSHAACLLAEQPRDHLAGRSRGDDIVDQVDDTRAREQRHPLAQVVGRQSGERREVGHAAAGVSQQQPVELLLRGAEPEYAEGGQVVVGERR